jgi:hypothetical protein
MKSLFREPLLHSLAIGVGGALLTFNARHVSRRNLGAGAVRRMFLAPSPAAASGEHGIVSASMP